jgi:Oxidoreductase molybdopterin binding domain
VRSPRPRRTNLALLVALAIAFATGTGAVAAGTSSGRWVVLTHGGAGFAVALLSPWKSMIIRRGLRRVRRGRWASLGLAALVSVALFTGIGYASGLVLSIGGVPGMWLHIAAALAAVPIIIWHVAARPARPRPTDFSRRALLRTGALGATAAGIYLATNTAVRVAGLPGAKRRFTGSHELGSFDPDSMPNTIWLNDRRPEVSPKAWRLQVVDSDGVYEIALDELVARQTQVRATLDCTSGWYATQDWTGVPVTQLIRKLGSARSLRVTSLTGYWVRFPVSDLDHLMLATAVGGAPLSEGHGFPGRLVAPGRRGFWWVKWVDRIELQDAPAWWQPPFPLS